MTTQQIEHQNQPKTHSLIEPLTQEAIDKVIQLLDEWMDDDSGYDEETWPELKEALDTERNLVSAGRLFDE
ncbi:hypothetical protein [Argonema antarcticum]|uniref:hypothetical protein n=1 Tax=Argonema antarcticum TaxID=2942763 RepID=UPI0020133042|nr:hypothetical protein [Argonema antarcticum]MCL1470742.1 hypothetical protein [Argonema antarcticum A004/B2]